MLVATCRIGTIGLARKKGDQKRKSETLPWESKIRRIEYIRLTTLQPGRSKFRPARSTVRAAWIIALFTVVQAAYHTETVSAQVQPDFTLTANPPYFYPYSVPYTYPDDTWMGNITAASIGGFAGTLNYTWAVNPSISALDQVSMSPFIVNLGAGQSFLSTLSVSWGAGYPPLPMDANWTITITATSGTLKHSINVTAIDGGVQVTYFGPLSATFLPGGGSVQANVSVSAVNFVGGLIQLGTGVTRYNDGFVCKQFSNNVAPGFATTLSKYSIQLTRNGSSNTTLTVSTNSSVAPGTYWVDIWASGPPGVPVLGPTVIDIAIPAVIGVTIPGFVMSNSAVSGGSSCESGRPLSIPTGGQGTTLIFVGGGCLDTNLTALTVPNGMNVTLTPSIVRNSASSTLKVSVSSTVPSGNYSIIIGGASCGQTARTAVPLTVTNPNGQVTSPNGLGTLYWILGSSIAGGAAATSLGIVAKRKGWISIRHQADASQTMGSKVADNKLSLSNSS